MKCEAKTHDCSNQAKWYIVMHKRIHGQSYWASGHLCDEDAVAFKEFYHDNGYDVRTEVPAEHSPML